LNILKIKDECRKNLSKYTEKAFSVIPKIERPVILDAGCCTGIISFLLLSLCNGYIFAVDTDEAGLRIFKKNAALLKLNNRIKILNKSILSPSLFDFKFDIIIAEGLLNIIGFENGMSVFTNYIKNSGYLILHDELRNDKDKRIYFKNENYQLLLSFELNEDIWVNEYFLCVKSKLKKVKNEKKIENELREIESNINRPENLKSIFYILKYGN